MRLGISSWALAWNIGVPGQEPSRRLDSLGLLDFAAGQGVSVVQFADNLPLQHLTEAERQALRDHARDRKIDIEIGTRGMSQAHLLRMIEICEFFRSPILRVVVDSAAHEPSVDEIVKTFKSLLPRFKAANVKPAIENHDRFDCQTFADIVKRLGPEYAGICLDTVNSFGALEGPEVVIEALARYTINLHVKDFVVRRHSSMMGFEIVGAPAGKGRLDIPALLETLKTHNPDCTAILEQWPPPQQDPDATARMEREWARESVRYLRTLIPV